MPDNSAPTPRPDPELVITPDEGDRLEKPVTSRRNKPPATTRPRKPRPRQAATTKSAPAQTSPAEADPTVDPTDAAEPVATSPPDSVEITAATGPQVAGSAEPAATSDAETVEVLDTAAAATSQDADPPGPVGTSEPEAPEGTDADAGSPAPAAVDPAPHHAPPAMTTATGSAPQTEARAAGPVTLAEALATDGVRRVIVTVSYLFCLVGALAAFGVVDSGSPRLSAVLSPSLSLLAAATQADRVWWVVLLGLAVYVAWLWLPVTAAGPRSRAMAYPSAISMTLLGIWFFVMRTGELTNGAFVSLLVVGALMVTLRATDRVPSRGFVGRQCAHLGFAAALGWMSVLSAGAIAGALDTHEVPAYFVSAETWGILGTTALLGVGMALVRYFPGRLYIAATLSWGFVCIAYARVIGQPRSYFIGVVALVSAVLILIAGAAVFLWARGRVRERVG